MIENGNKNNIIIYQAKDGTTKIDVKLENETIWLTQKQMAELFDIDRSVITKHINNIFATKELEENSNVQFLHVANSDKPVKFYNLDIIISVGYRVNSITAVHFRQWATQKLKEYIIKGFVLDDERLKLINNNYFDELLDRIRDIRSSEKVFYRKILDIYSTSIDYDPNVDTTKKFFSTIQNKIHWAVHGHTAAEIIFERACAEKNFMGITCFTEKNIKKDDIKIAKNYLDKKELEILNRIVSMYLDFAELQAIEQKPMTMANWIDKLDTFLKMTNKNILAHNGKISKLKAETKANTEYEKYKTRLINNELTEVEKHFFESIKQIEKKLPKLKK